MKFTISMKALAGLLFTALLFWETLSLLGSHGEFSSFHFEANSERFLLFVPAAIILWLLRHLLPGKEDFIDTPWQGD
ncbi:hypothetical protein [uncultured Cohaesibacter sp.]|uniref:hypothetical protein n=1 Tax=uncultured Cohaesibacter sp. TaxID=1002546 RepID=UPI0029C8A4C4|nr:hypothetical protein [uncultured Cohaesibacter sp.]